MHPRRIRRWQVVILALLLSGTAVMFALRLSVAAQAGSTTLPAPIASSQAEFVPNVSTPIALPPAKQAILDRIQQLRQAGLGRVKSAIVELPPRTTPAPWPSGIFESRQAPFPAALYTITNQWQDVVSGMHVQVYAGAETSALSQGLVVVRTISPDLRMVQTATYRTAISDGALHIVASHGDQLTLTATKGASFIFDVVSRTLTQTS